MFHHLVVGMAALVTVGAAVIAWRWARLAAKVPPAYQATMRASAWVWVAVTFANLAVLLLVVRS